jgi:hypothetical protein
MHAQMVVFSAVKRGHDEREWEDAAAGSTGDPALGRNPRFAVADGATGGFGSARWARHLAAGFVVGATDPDRPDQPPRPPALRADALRTWLGQAQARWHAESDAAASDLERLKLARVGGYATVLGCELSGLDGPRPRWDAVALGDTVLFHVRGERVLGQFPRIAAEEFGANPDGVSTMPDRLAEAVSRLVGAGGRLAVHDRLYLATDAFAQWLVAADRTRHGSVWAALAELNHPEAFRALVADRRRAGEMVNDDVTLLRVHLVADPPTRLVVCL